MIDLSKVRNYYVACGYTDLRLGIDGPAAVGITKKCTPLGSKMHTPPTFHQKVRTENANRLCSDRFRIAVEPVIVKRYRKTLVNKGFCKKKLDTRFDTHCIKIGVQFWYAGRDSNPRPTGS